MNTTMFCSVCQCSVAVVSRRAGLSSHFQQKHPAEWQRMLVNSRSTLVGNKWEHHCNKGEQQDLLGPLEDTKDCGKLGVSLTPCTCGTKVPCQLRPMSSAPGAKSGHSQERLQMGWVSGQLVECSVYTHHRYGARVSFKCPMGISEEEAKDLFIKHLRNAKSEYEGPQLNRANF